jgi:diadenosine tetraphosphatase ApaH/serine/threonine PP2A family protein phosphatase
MKLAILADIHANLEALNACLADAERRGAQAHAFLGDLVGYGADPHACLDIVRRHVAGGAIAVRGNHDDAALGGLCEELNFVAREAVVWTRAQLSAAERDFLADLPYVAEGHGCQFVHASADRPSAWEYVSAADAAARCLAAAAAPVVFAGHVHHPLLFHSRRGGAVAFAPRGSAPITLSTGRRWLALTGSVGQPRDDNPAAAYLLYDTERRELNFLRVPYDWMTAATKIRAAGLPASLANRLEHGT